MEFKMNIRLDGAAFEDDPKELSDILNDIASRVLQGKEMLSRTIFDSNSKDVGRWSIR